MPISVFVSYARENAQDCAALVAGLGHLCDADRLRIWYDVSLRPGSEFDREIRKELKRADLVLLVISDAFIGSKYCFTIELPQAMTQQRSGRSRVVPVIVDNCPWQQLPFAKLSCVPHGGTPISEQADPDAAYRAIHAEIESIVCELERKQAALVSNASQGISMSALDEIARWRAENLEAVGLACSPIPTDPEACRRYGMVRIDPLEILVDPFPTSEMEYVTFCAETRAACPPYLIGRTPRRDVPVVWVTAFEADAFARWVGKRLPTLEEWNEMAFGKPDGEQTTFPWGSEFDSLSCNASESGLGRLTRFTEYPQGRSAHGVYDVCGNSWDWTASEDGERIAVGGSFYDSGRKYCKRGASITWNAAERVQDIGIRCVMDGDG